MKNPEDRIDIYDTVIIGAGPAGLTASIFARNKGLEVIVIEGLRAGGQLKHLYPHKPVYNYPGYSRILAGELAQRIVQQVSEHEIPLVQKSPVQKINCVENKNFKIESTKIGLMARSIIFACGMGLFEPRRLQVPGEYELENIGIYYTIEDLSLWRDQKVAVVGGGNSAIDNALLLTEFRSSVTLIHNLSKFQADAVSVEKLYQSNIKVLLGWQVTKFEKIGNRGMNIYLECISNNENRIINVEKILINIGIISNFDFLLTLPLSLKGKQVRVDSEMRTSIPGVFACGDVVAYPGKVRLIVTAIGEAATAVNSLEVYLQSLKEKVGHGQR